MVEHVFGTLRNWHHDHFLMKGVEKVRAEFDRPADGVDDQTIFEHLLKVAAKPIVASRSRLRTAITLRPVSSPTLAITPSTLRCEAGAFGPNDLSMLQAT